MPARRPSLFRRVLLPSALPTAVSLAVHAALAGVLVTVGVRVALAPPPPPSTSGLAEISLLTPSAGDAGSSPGRTSAQRALDESRASGTLAAAPGVRADPLLRGADRSDEASAPALERSLPGSGLEDHTPDAPTAAPGSGARFAGLEAQRGLRIAYVVDGSGAMAATMPYVVDEVARSIARLGSEQQFRVIVYRAAPDGAGPESFRDSWADASAATKIAATRWLKGVVPAGRSTPLEGLRLALKSRPDVVFLLARSIQRSGPGAAWEEGTEATLAALDSANPLEPRLGRRRTIIKAVQFIEDDPSGLMQAIGAAHGDGAASYTVLRLDEPAP